MIVSSQSCDLLPVLQTVSLSGLFSTLRSYPWIFGRGIVWKDMGHWCCQHLQVKHPWDIVLIVWENELSGPLGKWFSQSQGFGVLKRAVSCLGGVRHILSCCPWSFDTAITTCGMIELWGRRFPKQICLLPLPSLSSQCKGKKKKGKYTGKLFFYRQQ